MKSDIEIIKEALANGPTPGPWKYDSGNVELEQAGTRNHIATIGRAREEKFPRVADWIEDGEYIAACSPDRIARILEQVEELEEFARYCFASDNPHYSATARAVLAKYAKEGK